MNFKSGFIALIGSPNVGKSTLLNTIIGTKISIVSKKPQTTRNRIAGVLTRADYQMVFLDTPGLHTPKNKLGEFMVSVAHSTAKDVDVALFIADAKMGVKERDEEILAKLKEGSLVIALNKIDAVSEEEISLLQNKLEGYNKPIFLISAKNGDGVAELIDHLKTYLTVGPKFYTDDMITDQPERLIMAELIREKALKCIGKEIPHGIGVAIEKMDYDEEKNIYNIDALIFCEKDSHKGIIIGAKGKMLKRIGTMAREDMQSFLEEKVFLQVWVKVKEDWRNKNATLKTLGYYGD